MNDEISNRIARSLGQTDLPMRLAKELSGADFHSLILSALKHRIADTKIQDVLKYSPVTKSCDLDGRLLHQVEALAYEAAEEFEVVELAPFLPLGAVSLLTKLDQANVLSTIRGFECASDPTVGMGIECAHRRKSPSLRKTNTRLCTVQRITRFPLPKNPAYTAHFKLFSLVTAGRDGGSFSFETEALYQHVRCYLSLIEKLMAKEFFFQDIVVEISDTRIVSELCAYFDLDRELVRQQVRVRDAESSARLLAPFVETWPKIVGYPFSELEALNLTPHFLKHLQLIEEKVAQPLRTEFKNVNVIFNTQRLTGLGYYEGPCFHIKVKNAVSENFALADGGFVNWSKVLLTDSKERLMTSAIGLELLCRVFRAASKRDFPA
ncbi:MAG TPA: hypothetical protein V6C97_12050 [Oculatellaceae cyanobacterium]